MKAKAATAGWDAAAAADERVEIQVEKAYMKGLKEGRERKEAEWNSLNASVEVKENRITDLLVKIQDMERRMLHNDAEMEDMKAKLEQAKLEASDAVMIFASGGGLGGEVGEVHNNAEIDKLQETLDNAQDEIVMLSERCESLQNEMKILEEKIHIYEQVSTDLLNTSRTEDVVDENEQGNEPQGELIMLKLRPVLAKGSSLWKGNKKDDCYVLYLSTTEEVIPLINTYATRDMLAEALGAAKAQTGSQAKVCINSYLQ
jgi:chromosome segregation ATPase